MQPATNGRLFLRMLVNKFFTGKPDSLSKIMPKEDADLIDSTRISNKEPDLMLFVPEKWLSSMDNSWLAPEVQKLSKPLQDVYEKAFPGIFGKEQLEASRTTYNDTIQDFLIAYLHSQWKEHEAPPKELLPTWELSSLLDMTRQEFLEVVDLLAMHDLVEEMRHIVDKRLLQAVLEQLSSEQQHYLRMLLRQKSRLKPTSLSIKELLKEGTKFPQTLHKLGLKRMAFALSGASPDFLWHILHRIDLPRAKFLQNHIQKEEVPNQTPQALVQVVHSIQFLKTEMAP